MTAVATDTLVPAPVPPPQADGESAGDPPRSPPAQEAQAPQSPTSNNHDTSTPTQPSDNPQVASLQAIFPTFDVTVLQSVLESVGGNQDRAIDMLLGMSDPGYVSQEHAGPTQTELDEEYARRIMMEDSQQQNAYQVYERGWEYGPPAQSVPYQRRMNRPHGAPPPQGAYLGGQGDGNRDTMSEVKEEFSRIAESGKRTFTNIFSKVKQKMQEFDNPRPNQSGSQQTNWGNGTVGGSNVSPHQQPSYYDPNAAGNEAGSTQGLSQGYDLTTTSPSHQTSAPAPPAEGQTGPSRSPVPTTTSGPPAGLDPSKIGMLPKKPVSLLSSSPPPNQQHDEEELDYVENPFEEGKK